MASIDLQDLLEMTTDEGPSSLIKTIKQNINIHQVFFDEDIGEPKKYRDLINMLYIASESDEFNFFMNSSGGQLSAALAIIEGIRGTEATVRAIITGECHSAASIITLNCHEIMVTDSAQMLIHTASYGSGGNAHMVQKHVDFSTRHINKMLDDTYTGFLSTTEITDLKKGVEYWLDSDEISSRLDSRLKYLQSKEKKVSTSKKKKQVQE